MKLQNKCDEEERDNSYQIDCQTPCMNVMVFSCWVGRLAGILAGLDAQVIVAYLYLLVLITWEIVNTQMLQLNWQSLWDGGRYKSMTVTSCPFNSLCVHSSLSFLSKHCQGNHAPWTYLVVKVLLL